VRKRFKFFSFSVFQFFSFFQFFFFFFFFWDLLLSISPQECGHLLCVLDGGHQARESPRGRTLPIGAHRRHRLLARQQHLGTINV
jgi:hypothetical protein